jgi:hypothetical protein
MRYDATKCTISFDGCEEEIPVEFIDINRHDFTVNVDVRLEGRHSYCGLFKILQYNPRFFIVTPWQKIKYYLHKLRYEVIKKLLGWE